jgi:hypothetical protein
MTTDPLPDKWNSRDLPVLRRVVQHFEEGDNGTFIDSGDIATDLALDPKQVSLALNNLERGGYVSLGGGFGAGGFVERISGTALVASGSWPTPESALDRIIAALEAIAANTDATAEDRTKAQRFATWLKSSATTVGIGVATAAITGQMPGAGS